MTESPHPLQWDEPDAGCVSCGAPYVTVADHRCGDCLTAPVRHCPHCLGTIGELVDRDVVRRLRAASLEVSDTWTRHRYFDRLRDRERVLDARLAAGGER